MRELSKLGHEVTLLTREGLQDDARRWLEGVKTKSLATEDRYTPNNQIRDSRFSRYWGIEATELAAMKRQVEESNPEVVIGVGPEMLVYLAEIRNRKTVWYAADSPLLVECSRLGIPRIKNIITFILYERMLKKFADLTWVVSSKDRNWSRCAGGGKVSVIPNGVDTEYYAPEEGIETTASCVFWGNLGFGPNRDAMRHFLNTMWPKIQELTPEVEFNLCGVNLQPDLSAAIKSTKGIIFHENLEDLRPIINRSRIAVFPFVSGGGVKNKLLEAAAMGKIILASNRCSMGLEGEDIPIEFIDEPEKWIKRISLHLTTSTTTNSGTAVRDWVLKHHQWELSAKKAERQLKALICKD